MSSKEQLLNNDIAISGEEVQTTTLIDPRSENTVVEENNMEVKNRKHPHHKTDSTLKEKSIGQVLTEMFRQGDKIEVFSGADQIDGVGSFIESTNEYLIWANHQGNIAIQRIGGAFSVRKVNVEKTKNKRNKKKKEETISRSPSKNEELTIEEILKEAEKIGNEIETSLKQSTDSNESV